MPAVGGVLDLYAEYGRDPKNRRIQTYGAYFPSLYQDYGLDLFIEYASRDAEPFTVSALAYLELRDGFKGLAGVRKARGDGWEFAIGGMKRFGSLELEPQRQSQ